MEGAWIHIKIMNPGCSTRGEFFLKSFAAFEIQHEEGVEYEYDPLVGAKAALQGFVCELE